MSEKLQIAIVGGGIGGLAAALALRARGLSVTVFEQASELREIGAGVSLFPNATLLLQRIDLADRIEKIGSPITGLVNWTSLGELIGTSAAPSTGIQSYNVHRADFLKLLADAQTEGTLHFNHRLSAARETNGRVQLTFSSGVSVEADLVIGAAASTLSCNERSALKPIHRAKGLWPTEV